MNAKERLIKFLNYISISQRKFEESVGLSNGFVNNIGDSIRVRSLEKISSVYPELNTAWLLTGTGTMLKSTPEGIVSGPRATTGTDTTEKIINEYEERIKRLEFELESAGRHINMLEKCLDDSNTIIEGFSKIVESLKSTIDILSPVKNVEN